MRNHTQARARRKHPSLLAAFIGLLLIAAPVHAGPALNVLSKIKANHAGAVTQIVLVLKAKPTFTVYRLERPPRVIVDLANTTVKGYEDPLDIQSWAVGQVAVARFSDATSAITRVMIGFRRQATYKVRARGHQVVVTVSAMDRPAASKSAVSKSAAPARSKPGNKARKARTDFHETQVKILRAKAELKAARALTRKLRVQAQGLAGTTTKTRAALAQSRAAMQRTRAAAKRTRAAMQRTRAAMQRTRAEARRAKAEAAAARAKARKLKLSAERLKGTAQAAYARIKWARASARAARLEAAQTRAEARRLRFQVQKLKASADHLQKKARRARRQARRLRTQASWVTATAARARWMEAKSRAVQREVARLQAEKKRVRAESRRVRADLRRLRLERTHARKETSEQRWAALKARKEAGRQRSAARKARKELKSLKVKVLKAKHLARKIRHKADLTRSEYERLQQRTVRARTQADALRGELYKLSIRRARMKKETARLRRQLAKAEKDVNRANRQAQAAWRRVLTARTEVHSARSEVLTARKRLARVRQQVSSLRGASAAMKTRLTRRQAWGQKALQTASKRLVRARTRLAEIESAQKTTERAKRSAESTLTQLRRERRRNLQHKQVAEARARKAEQLRERTLRRKLELDKQVVTLLRRHRALKAVTRLDRTRQKRLKKALSRLEGKVAQVQKAVRTELKRARQARSARIREEHLAWLARKASTEVAGHQGRLAVQVARLTQLKKALSIERSRQKRRLQTLSHEERAKQAKVMKKAVKKRLAAIRTLEKEVSALNRSRYRARTKLLGLKAAHQKSARRAARLEARLNQARKALTAATAQRDQAADKVRVVQKQLFRVRRARLAEQVLKKRVTARRTAEERRLARLKSERRQLELRMARLRRRTRAESGKLKATVKARLSTARRIQTMQSRLAWLKRRQAAARRLTRPPARPRLKKIKRIPRKLRVTSRVASVNFRDTGASHRIMLKMRGKRFDYNLDRSTARTVALKVYGATVSRKLERTLDTSAFRGPVKLVSVYRNRARRGEVKVVVDLKHPARYKVTRRGPFLWVDFMKGSRVPKAPRAPGALKAPAVAVAASRVSGYSSTSRLYAPKRASGRAWKRKYRMRGRGLGPRVDMDFKDADIHNVLRLVGQVWRKNVVVADDVKGRITIRMVNVRVGRALDVILKTKQLGMVWEGRNILRIARMADINKEIEAIQKARAARRKMMPIVMRLIHVNYADAEKISKQLKENVISKRGKVTWNKRTNTIIIRDVPPNIEIAKKLVRNLDTPTPQVLIEARIVEARSTFLREIGIQWGGSILATPGLGNPTGLLFPNSITSAGGAGDDVTRTGGLLGAAASNPNFAVNMPATVGSGQGGALGLSLGTLGGAFNVNLRLSAMEETGQVRIISSPKITTLDNVEAKIEQGVRIPISVVSAQGVNTQFEEANLALIVTPHVTNDGRVRLKLLVQKNEPDFVNTGARGDPTILKKSAKSEMLIRDGDTAVIGGIYTRTTSVSYSKVPWFADIPIIGWLFKKRKESDERSEVLIFVTPRVIKAGAAAGGGTRGRRARR